MIKLYFIKVKTVCLLTGAGKCKKFKESNANSPWATTYPDRFEEFYFNVEQLVCLGRFQFNFKNLSLPRRVSALIWEAFSLLWEVPNLTLRWWYTFHFDFLQSKRGLGDRRGAKWMAEAVQHWRKWKLIPGYDSPTIASIISCCYWLLAWS